MHRGILEPPLGQLRFECQVLIRELRRRNRLKKGTPDQEHKFAYDEVDQVNGEWDRLLRKLREKYGYSKSEAKDEEIGYLMEADEDAELGDDDLEDTSIDDP